MAAAGHHRIQQYSMGRRLEALCRLLAQRGPGRAPASDGEAALGRAVAMLPTWASGPAAAAAAVEACRLLPDEPRALNALAVATLRWRGGAGGEPAFHLLRKACDVAPGYLPARRNLVELLAAAGQDESSLRAMHESHRRAHEAPTWHDVDGPVLPLGFAGPAIERSLVLQAAVREGSPRSFASVLTAVR
jgi:hypothetical protein